MEDESKQTYALLLEYCLDGDLDKVIHEDNSSPLSWDDRHRYALGIASGLAYMHSEGVLHRDVSAATARHAFLFRIEVLSDRRLAVPLRFSISSSTVDASWYNGYIRPTPCTR